MENGKPYITTVRVRPARREKCIEHGVSWDERTSSLGPATSDLVEVTVCGETRAIVDVRDSGLDGVLYAQDGFSERRIVTLVNAAYALMDASRKVPA